MTTASFFEPGGNDEIIAETVQPVNGGATGGPPIEPPVSSVPSAPDPFDPVSYRDSGAVGIGVGANVRQQVVIPICKPSKNNFCRTNPALHARQLYIIEGEMSRPYLIAPGLVPQLAPKVLSKIKRMDFALSIYPNDLVFFWPYKEPSNAAGQSTIDAIATAATKWLRPVWEGSIGTYLLEYPDVAPPEPTWPTKPLRDLVEMAFTSCLINSLDHPLLLQIMGATL